MKFTDLLMPVPKGDVKDYLKPFGAFQATSEMFGKELSPAQQQMFDDWNQGKFQRGDIALARGAMNQGNDNVMFGGLPVTESIGKAFDRNMSNTFGDSDGTASQNSQAIMDGFGTADQAGLSEQELYMLQQRLAAQNGG